MITSFFGSQTLAALPNSRLKTPMVPGPHTSWVMRMSTFTHTLSPAWTCALPLARASTFSVRVIRGTTITPTRTHAQMEFWGRLSELCSGSVNLTGRLAFREGREKLGGLIHLHFGSRG